MLAAVLENKGYLVKIADLTVLGLSENAVPQIIRNEKPDIVGISSMTSTISSAIKIAGKVKETNNGVLVVFGGAHVSILPEETLKNNPEIDIIVRGEGEETMLELVESVERKTRDLATILGITFRSEVGIISTPSRPPLSNLDTLPFPAFHLLPKGKYRLHHPFGRNLPAIPIMVSRGCPYSCIFCSKSVFGKKYRHNSPIYVVKQIRFLIDSLNVKEIKFYDDVFTLDRSWVVAICAELKKQGISIPWSCETRVNLVDGDLLRMMKDAGCYMIAFGVESGDQNLLNKIGKNITLDQITEAFRATREVGISTVSYFMLGVPQETPETIKKTIEYAKRLNPDFAQFSIATPYPGTELEHLFSEKGVLPKSWDGYVYADLKSMKGGACEMTKMSSQELLNWNRKAYTSYYLRPRYIWMRLKKMSSLDELKTNAKGFHMLLAFLK
jgi:radical SAM superfamily enzyme YgiQ (UPF0313 family)